MQQTTNDNKQISIKITTKELSLILGAIELQIDYENQDCPYILLFNNLIKVDEKCDEEKLK